MATVENEGMKLYEKVTVVGGSESERLAMAMEDFGIHGTYISAQSLDTDLRTLTFEVLHIELF